MRKEHNYDEHCHCHEEHCRCHEEHGCSCTGGHTHECGQNDLKRIIFGALFFAVGLGFEYFTDFNISLWIYILAYIIVGYEVLANAFKNLFSAKFLDENFLMALSSIAAFCIGSYSEAVAVMLFYNVGEYFQGAAVKKSKKSISDLMDLKIDTANVIKDGEILILPCEEVNPGDIILIKPGEKVPFDALVTKGKTEIDTSALTGESKLFAAFEGSEILSGSINKSGSIEARVQKSLSESTATKIIKMVEMAADKKAPAEKFITKFSKIYTPVVVLLALLIATVPAMIFGDFYEWIRRGCVFLVISCPCALVISVPLSFFAGIGKASKTGILIKGGNYLEALSDIGAVVFDKTGTLTKGEFGISKVIPKEGVLESDVLIAAATAEQISNHPIALSVLKTVKNIKELPKVTESENEPGRGISVKTEKGEFLVGSSEMLTSKGIEFQKYCGFETVIYVAENGEYKGAIILNDEIKTDSKKAVLNLKKLNIRTYMLTGDKTNVAKDVCDNLGIGEFYAELLPQDKVFYMEKIKKETAAGVIFIGDGINDAPVLALSDVGVAMGGIGSDAAIEAADLVIMNDNPSKIIEAIIISKKTKRIVKENIIFSLAVKILFLVLGAFGIAGMWEAVFSDVGVMIIAVFNSMRILKIRKFW